MFKEFASWCIAFPAVCGKTETKVVHQRAFIASVGKVLFVVNPLVEIVISRHLEGKIVYSFPSVRLLCLLITLLYFAG